jgi:hypothetical protein
LRGKEFGWLADDLQQPTKTHFGYSKIKKKSSLFIHSCLEKFTPTFSKVATQISFGKTWWVVVIGHPILGILGDPVLNSEFF